MDDTLRDLAEGRITVEEARTALAIHAVAEVGDFGRFDTHRDVRTGIPEVILAEGKSPAQVHGLVVAACGVRGQALASRLTREAFAASRLAHEAGLVVRYDEEARFLTVRSEGFHPPAHAGTIAILCAGTSDIPVAKEAAAIADAMGVRVHLEADCGVAGPARLRPALERALATDPGCLVVAAGREGTLPTVVAALSPVPVIGLPISTGYGAGGQGHAALHSMLQSCSPLVVVNIDAGVVAGAMAARIARLATRP